MNIFVLHEDPHAIKMILESAQILCTVHHLLGGTAPYKPTHKSHLLKYTNTDKPDWLVARSSK